MLLRMTGSDPLQFDRVEKPAATAACANCKRPLGATYYQANGFVICESCRTVIEEQWNANSSVSRFPVAVLWGVGAAALGAGLYFGFTAIAKFELSLIAIAVGYIVGRAVRAGSGGRGGVPYQLLAVFLTYSAIVFSYGFLIVRDSDAIALNSFISLIPLLYTLPFQNVGGNILGLVIIGIGLYEAWVLNKPATLTITGPYQVGAAPSQPA